MLATPVPKPFHLPGWIYEEKYDGYRILAYKEADKVTLFSRNQHDRTATFPEVADAVSKLKFTTLLLDGEVVAFDEKGISRFQLLQRGSSQQSLAAFDCLYRNGEDLRTHPLKRRRAELIVTIGRPTSRLFVSRIVSLNGLEAYRIAKRKGSEGVVAKDESSAYESGRSRKWLKVKVRMEEEFVIGGYTPPQGSRPYIGALLLGAYKGEDLHFVGKVGTGFTEETLASLAKQFRHIIRKNPPFVDPPREKGVTWLKPQMVAQIAFSEWTADMKLRQPVFLGLRDDKSSRDVVLPEHR